MRPLRPPASDSQAIDSHQNSGPEGGLNDRTHLVNNGWSLPQMRTFKAERHEDRTPPNARAHAALHHVRAAEVLLLAARGEDDDVRVNAILALSGRRHPAAEPEDDLLVGVLKNCEGLPSSRYEA